RWISTNGAGRWRPTTCWRASGGGGGSSCGQTCSRSASATGSGPANGWWEDGVQVEALAALAASVERYDTGEWDDPPGKLSLLYDLERVRELIRGTEPFHPGRDRIAFSRFLIDAGCQSPPGTDGLAKRRAGQR
ncbi:MAG: hypothetical protein ACXVHD_25810, partial [Solirubrobacteraceae bacterium]